MKLVSELDQKLPLIEAVPVLRTDDMGTERLNNARIFASEGNATMKSNPLFDSLAGDILSKGSYLRFCAHGNSMAPFIRNGDTILVEPKKASELRIGDIVFCRRPKGRHVAHRLIGKNGDNGSMMLATRGDNLERWDAPVLPEQILGRVVRIESQGNKLWIGGRVGWVMNHLIVYASCGNSYGQGALRRGLTKLWWLIGRKRLCAE